MGMFKDAIFYFICHMTFGRIWVKILNLPPPPPPSEQSYSTIQTKIIFQLDDRLYNIIISQLKL